MGRLIQKADQPPMPASKSDVNVVTACCILHALHHACHMGKNNQEDFEGLQRLLWEWITDPIVWHGILHQPPLTKGSWLNATTHTKLMEIMDRFMESATRAQKEAIADRVIKIYIEGARRPRIVPCPPLMMAKRENAENTLVAEGVYDKRDVTRSREFYQKKWQTAARRASLLSGGLKAAQLRAAERTYAPGEAGANEAANTFKKRVRRE